MTELIKSSLNSLTTHVQKNDKDGMRMESYVFHSAMQEYGPHLSSNTRAELNSQYLKIIEQVEGPSSFDGNLEGRL